MYSGRLFFFFLAATVLTALIPMELLIKILQLDCVRLMKFYNILCAACMEEQIKSKLK